MAGFQIIYHGHGIETIMHMNEYAAKNSQQSVTEGSVVFCDPKRSFNDTLSSY